jgi:hypothetical protein
MIRIKQLPTFQGVATGRAATVNLTLGVRYRCIWLRINGTIGTGEAARVITKADLTSDIRVKINGNVERPFTVAQADAIYSLNGAQFGVKEQADGVYVPIWFDDPFRKNPAEVLATAWIMDTASVSSFQVEVEIPSTVLNPSIDGAYEFDDIPAGMKLGGIVKWIRQDLPAIGTKQDFNSLDRKEFIAAIHMFPTVEPAPKFINLFKFTAAGVEVRELQSYLQNAAVLRAREMFPDTSAVPIVSLVFDYDDRLNNALLAEGLSEMTLHVEYNLAANGNLPVIIERVGQPN